MAQITFSGVVGAGTPTQSIVDSGLGGAGIKKYKIILPANVSDAVITILPEPGATLVGLKGDANGTGALTWTAAQTRTDTDEVVEAVVGMVDERTKTLEAPGRIVATYATGNTLSWIWHTEWIASRVIR